MDHLAAARAGFMEVEVAPELRQQAFNFLEQWLIQPEFADYRPQLEWLIEEGQWAGLVDRFYQILPFGTGGRRGPVGIGPNRMNPWTLTASVQGHCQYLKERFPGEVRIVVALAYDVRRFEDTRKQYCPSRPNPVLGLSSKDLVRLAAQTYAANGIHSYLPNLESPRYWATPELSFAIRRLKIHGGLNVSASHNPADDNGGKFYDEHGGQPVPPDDQIMADLVDQVTEIRAMEWGDAFRSGSVTILDDTLHRDYLELIAKQSLLGTQRAGECRIVFTPLHGVGGATVLEALRRQQFDVLPVPEQIGPNGLFPDVASANPEAASSMNRAVALAEAKNADLVLSSDPDADRIGAMIPAAGGWRFVSGNEIAALLTHFKLEQLAARGQLPTAPIVMCSLVTTSMITKIGRHFGCQVVSDLLVGFKYVADVLRHLEQSGRFGEVRGRPDDLVIACEESHGILVTPEIRDKDAGGGALLFAELAALQKQRGRSVLDYLEHLYRTFGFHHNSVKNLAMTGVLGRTQMLEMLRLLREAPPREIGGRRVVRFEDLQQPESRLGPLQGATDHANRNVLVFHLEGEGKLTLRPSGTEPKAKAYVELATAPCPSAMSLESWQQKCRQLDAEAEALAAAFVTEALGRVKPQS